MSDLIDMLETMAQNGHAPETGCNLFGVGFDDAFARLKHVYIEGQFSRGRSTEKFVIGPYGSGKTHFLRQLFECAEQCGCAYAEVHLNKDVDFTQRLVVYKEIARCIRLPNQARPGIRELLRESIERAKEQFKQIIGSEHELEALIDGWINAIDQIGFEEARYARVLKKALRAIFEHDTSLSDDACRWLEGDVNDRQLCKLLGENPISTKEENLFANRAALSLFQFIRHTGCTGSIIGFDEAEQGFSVDKKKFNKILSMLQASINAMSDLKGASALVLYALTPDLVSEMDRFDALRQRVADPSDRQTFFDGNTYAAKIDLTRRGSPEEDLVAIGRKITELFCKGFDCSKLPFTEEDLIAQSRDMALEVAASDPTSSNRRTMTKRISQHLLQLHEQYIGSGRHEPKLATVFAEPEV